MRTRGVVVCGQWRLAMKPTFAKPAITISDQIDKLVDRGMIVADRALAEHSLQHISYYRLSAYWLPFEHPKGQPGPRFRTGTTFADVLALYEFDRKLRLLALDAIERIEVAVRGSWAYQLALLGGPFGYVDPVLYRAPQTFTKNCNTLDREVFRSKDTFILHYKAKYSGPARPPVWMAAELLSFGALSQWYAALKLPKIRQSIADVFDIDERIFVAFVHQLTVVRNICAHHNRLWNRQLDVGFALPEKQPIALAAAMNRTMPRRIYNSFAMTNHLLARAEPENDWGDRLKRLMATLPAGRSAEMGFPDDWQDLELWERGA